MTIFSGFYGSLSGTNYDTEWQWGMYYQCTDPGTHNPYAAWQDAVGKMWNGDGIFPGGITHISSNQTTATTHRVYDFEPSNNQKMLQDEVVVNWPGVLPEGSWPYQCSPVIVLRTAPETSRSRGRIYLPPLGVSRLGAGRLTYSAAVDVYGYLALFFQTLATYTCTPLVYSRRSRLLLPVVSGYLNRVLATQQRRAAKAVPDKVELLF